MKLNLPGDYKEPPTADRGEELNDALIKLHNICDVALNMTSVRKILVNRVPGFAPHKYKRICRKLLGLENTAGMKACQMPVVEIPDGHITVTQGNVYVDGYLVRIVVHCPRRSSTALLCITHNLPPVMEPASQHVSFLRELRVMFRHKNIVAKNAQIVWHLADGSSELGYFELDEVTVTDDSGEFGRIYDICQSAGWYCTTAQPVTIISVANRPLTLKEGE
jgi:hypothetical protein